MEYLFGGKFELLSYHKTTRQQEIFGIIMQHQPISISDISKQLKDNISVPTLNRELTVLKNESLILSEGNGPSIKYKINVEGLITTKIDQELFFQSESDERKIINRFNINIIERLSNISIFNDEENSFLEELTNKYRKNITESGSTILNKEFERLMIELSWKSSQIEGNTYDLLDTEQLLNPIFQATEILCGM
jgi:hypothetical protein